MSERPLPLRGLQAFEAVARHLSFARAAAELHVTPGAISQQVKLLEDQVGVPLFERGRKLQLTPAAAAVMRQLHTAMEGLRLVSRQLRGKGTERVVVISAAPSFASRWLIPRMEHFGARHPDIELRLLATRRLVDFGAEDVDVGVRYGSGPYAGLYVERLRGETVIAVANPRVATRLRRPADLAEATLLRNSSMSWDATFPDWPTWLQGLGVSPRKRLRVREFEEATFVIDAALAGLGVALVWRTLVSADLAAGRLVALFNEQPLTNAYHFVCLPERLNEPGIAAFRQWLKDETRADQASAEPLIL
jgi:LysR family glycine cleavage system transcriptional activator